MRARPVAIALLLLMPGAPAGAQSLGPPGAAACSGCHPPTAAPGITVPPLNGRMADDIVVAMAGFRSGQRPATVMDRIAKGFSEEEARALAAWFAAQR